MQLKQYQIENRLVREEKLLSEGGYGYILKAVDIRTREVFALKKSFCQGTERTKIAQNELNIMRTLPKHPNIVNFVAGTLIYENGQQLCLILMEFCEGGSIFDLMAKDPNTRMPESKIINIMKQITSGIKAFHTLQPPLAHRDIKIENVLFQHGVCKLCDFGSVSPQRINFNQINQRDFALYEEEFEKNTTLMYRPPEMADLFLRYEVNEKVDVWMLGCVLFTMCYYVHPFQESSKLAISTATYNIPKESRYSEKLNDFIRLLLTPNPKIRPTIFEVENIINNFNEISYIKLNPQAIEIKNREKKLEQEMEQFNKNSHKVQKFDGDVPIEELMKLKNRIQSDKDKPIPNAQQFRQNSNKTQQPVVKQNQFSDFGDFAQAQPIHPQSKSENLWDAFGNQQTQSQQNNQFGFDFNSTSKNQVQEFGFSCQPQKQTQQVKFDLLDDDINSNNNNNNNNPTFGFNQELKQPNDFGFNNSHSQQTMNFGFNSQPQQQQFSFDNNFGWGFVQQQQSQPQPQNQAQKQQQTHSQPQTLDLIDLDNQSTQQQNPEKIDLSNIIL